MRRARPTVSLDAATPDGRASAHELSAPPAPDPVERERLEAALEVALAKIRPEYRSAIVLRYQEGLSFDEIAHVLGMPATTARTHVHRARKELAALLDAAGWGQVSIRPFNGLQRH